MGKLENFEQLMAQLDEAIENASVEQAASTCKALDMLAITEAFCRKMGREPISKEEIEDFNHEIELSF